jgi:hypothetical protein
VVEATLCELHSSDVEDNIVGPGKVIVLNILKLMLLRPSPMQKCLCRRTSAHISVTTANVNCSLGALRQLKHIKSSLKHWSLKLSINANL